MEFWLPRSLSHELFSFFHDGILAIAKPFIRTFFFLSRWNSGYHESFHTNIFSFLHDGILAITKPFIRTFFFLSRWNSGYHEAFHTNFFLSHARISQNARGKTRFIYITKSIYIGSISLKTLPLDLELPLQGKYYGPPYCNEIAKKKVNVFVPKITYRFVIRILLF
jgi:hypothetical protein